MAFNKKPRPQPNVNEGIRFPEVRVIFPDGRNEILKTNIAIQKAKALDLDLVVVAPTSVPPVAKIIDEGKYAYEQKKAKHEAKQNQHVQQTKELKFKPAIDEHDYQTKARHALRFLKEGHKVRAVCNFKGREITHADLGREILQRLIQDTSEVGKPESNLKQEGRSAVVIIVPIGKKC